MRILLDFDSTTADLIQHQVTCCNERFGTTYHHDQFTDWNWWFDKAEPEHSDFVWGYECFQSREWTLSIPPVPGAIEGITELLDEGHTLALVSDRMSHMGEWLMSWLKQYGIAIPIHTTGRYNRQTKLEVIRSLGLELVIEDASHHAAEMARSGLVTGVLLLDKPWNKDVRDHPKIARCFGWGDVVGTMGLIQFMWGADSEMVIRN